MAGTWIPSGIDNGGGYGSLGIDGTDLPSELMKILLVNEITPGSSPSYQACKTIYAYHPLGRKMVEAPLEMAMSQRREIAIPDAPEDDLVKAYWKEWGRLGNVGADSVIFRIAVLSRIYGVGSLFVGSIDQDKNSPLDPKNLWKEQLYFNMLDPLNTAGSLVLNQDPTAPDFLHPQKIRAAGEPLHPSRSVVLINEQPIWIEWTESAFGFIGRSVYQRAFYPLKSFLLSMLADNAVQQKLMLLVAKMKTPGSVIDNRARGFFSWKRSQIKEGSTGNVLGIGLEESIESLDLLHVKEPGEYSRTNIIKNIATAAGMPAVILANETLTEGFGEGTEDAKQIARYIDRVRMELGPIYQFIDDIVMRRAWNPEFYESIQRKYPGLYGGKTYDEAFYEWKDGFSAEWPNLLQEPQSEQDEAEAKKIKIANEVAKTLMDAADPANKARIASWLADQISGSEKMWDSPLVLDEEEMASYVAPLPDFGNEPIEP